MIYILRSAIYKTFDILFHPLLACANMHRPLDVDKILDGVHEGSPIPEASRVALLSTADSCPEYARGCIFDLIRFIENPTDER